MSNPEQGDRRADKSGNFLGQNMNRPGDGDTNLDTTKWILYWILYWILLDMLGRNSFCIHIKY